MTEKPSLFSPGIGRRGMTELHYAAYCGDHESLNRCLEAGMDPNQKDEYRGYTALHWLSDMAAAGGGPRDLMAKELIQHGADISIVSKDGCTALQLANEAGGAGPDIAKILLSYKGDGKVS